MGGCIVWTRIMLLLLFVPLFLHFPFSPIFTHCNFSSHFSEELWGLKGWNLVHTWTVGRCIVHTGIRLLLHICPFISSFFFLSNFQTLKFFITLFSGMLGLEGWNLVHMWTVGRCIVSTRIRLLLLILSLCFFYFSFSPIFKHYLFSSHFSQELWGLEGWSFVHVDSGQLFRVYWNQATAAYSSLYFFLFLSLNFPSHFSQELWGLESWNLVHTWTVGRCIMYTGIRLLLLICPFISSFFFLNFLFFSLSPVFSSLYVFLLR